MRQGPGAASVATCGVAGFPQRFLCRAGASGPCVRPRLRGGAVRPTGMGPAGISQDVPIRSGGPCLCVAVPRCRQAWGGHSRGKQGVSSDGSSSGGDRRPGSWGGSLPWTCRARAARRRQAPVLGVWCWSGTCQVAVTVASDAVGSCQVAVTSLKRLKSCG